MYKREAVGRIGERLKIGGMCKGGKEIIIFVDCSEGMGIGRNVSWIVGFGVCM